MVAQAEDRGTIGEGSRGPITTKLQAMYVDAVNGRLKSRQSWLTHI